MGVHTAEQAIEIEAPAQECFEAIVEYETFPEWQDAVLATDVLERYDDGLGKIVELHVDAKFREVRYRLHYHYEVPSRVWWDFMEGEGVKQIEGEYSFEEANGVTTATYTLGIDPGVWVPGKIARTLNEGIMRRSVEDLKARVESLRGDS